MQLCIFRPQTNVQEGQEQHTGGHRSPTALFVFPQNPRGQTCDFARGQPVYNPWLKKKGR